MLPSVWFFIERNDLSLNGGDPQPLWLTLKGHWTADPTLGLRWYDRGEAAEFLKTVLMANPQFKVTEHTAISL